MRSRPNALFKPFRYRSSLLVLLFTVPLSGLAWRDQAAASDAPQNVVDKAADEPAPLEPGYPDSAAERINGIRKLLEADRLRLSELNSEADALRGEFADASADFEAADAALNKAVPANQDDRNFPDDADSSLAGLKKTRAAARDRFDRVIARRNAVQSQIETLTEKIALEEKALARATDLDSPSPDEAKSNEALVPAAAGETRSTVTQKPESGGSNASQPGSAVLGPLTGMPPQSDAKPTAEAKAVKAGTDPQIDAARRELIVKQRRLRSEREGIELLDRSIEVFERDLANSKQLVAAVQNEHQALQTELEEIAADDDSPTALALRSRAEKVRADLEDQQARVAQSSQLLDRLRERRKIAAKRIEEAGDEIESAERQVWFMESPLAPRRVYGWLVEVGPKLLAIIFAMVAAWWGVRLIGKRIVGGLVWRSERGSDFERQARAETLGRVFQSGGSLAVVILGVLALLQQTGIDVTVLLGGAAVIGAVLAFGSQNLIRDYFSGFMILAENQYSVGNVVRIGDKSGVVEDISLRLTVLRDEEGVVHFIPHNQVTTVSNLTHGWSRAVFAIGVGYREDVDRIISILRELAIELRRDPGFGPKIIADPEMQGVDALAESAVVVKFLLKTRPLQQWSVKREMLRRIKNRFDQEGIEIPFPHQTIYYHSMDDADDASDSERTVSNHSQLR